MGKRNWKKWLAVLLCMAMCMGNAGVSRVYAAVTDGETGEELEETPEQEEPAEEEEEPEEEEKGQGTPGEGKPGTTGEEKPGTSGEEKPGSPEEEKPEIPKDDEGEKPGMPGEGEPEEKDQEDVEKENADNLLKKDKEELTSLSENTLEPEHSKEEDSVLYSNEASARIADNGITKRIAELRNKYPDGKYWHRGNDGVNKVRDYGCGDKDYRNICSVYDGGYQCWAFASMIFTEIFGKAPNTGGGGTRGYDTKDVRVGDYVRFAVRENSTYGHSFLVIAKNGNNVTVVESNNPSNCRIKWDRTLDLNSAQDAYAVDSNGHTYKTKCYFSFYIRAHNYDEIANSYSPEPTGSYMETGYSQTLRNGQYHIVSALDSNWGLHVENTSYDTGANVHLWEGGG